MSIWRDHGTWRYRVQRQRRVIAGGARTRAEAVELEAKALRDLQQTRLGLAPQRTVADALAAYLECPEFLKLGEKRRVIARIAEIETHLRGEAVADAHLVADRIIKSGLQRGLSPYTINAPLRVLRRVLRLAARRWEWGARPEKLSLVREHDRQVYLTKPEAKALLAELKGDARAWIAFGIYAGLRAGEVGRLVAESVQDNVLVLSPRTKNGRPRAIPILPPLRPACARLPLSMPYNTMSKHFQRARAAIGRPDVRFHDLRHTYGSWLAQAGAQATDIRDLLGHTTVLTTNRYMHLNAERLQEVASRILLETVPAKKSQKRRKTA